MKSSIPTPVVVVIIVVVLAGIGFFVWKGANGSSTTDVAEAAKSVNTGKPATEAIQNPQGDAMLMGGKKGGR